MTIVLDIRNVLSKSESMLKLFIGRHFLGKKKVKFNIDSSIPYISHPYHDDEYRANRLMYAKAKELGFDARMWIYEHGGEFEPETIKLRHQTLK